MRFRSWVFAVASLYQALGTRVDRGCKIAAQACSFRRHRSVWRLVRVLAMDSIAMVEELAWLVKDNLSCKHLILSMEETFIEFLAPSHSGEDILMLEPMVSYHRMLVHRLAEIFGLVHESIGEGDDRRLIIEKCENSTVPDVLVSDILECNDFDGEDSCSQTTRQLLKRSNDPSGAQKKPSAMVPQMSFEERQAAYLAARERIFSEGWGRQGDNTREPAASRPRSVPVVARRMIAHALGKHILANAYPSKAVSSSGVSFDKTTEKTSINMSHGDDSETGQGNPLDSAVKTSDHSPAKAAKRMFAQALGVHFSSSSKGSSKQPGNPVNGRVGASQGNMLRYELLSNNMCVGDTHDCSAMEMPKKENQFQFNSGVSSERVDSLSACSESDRHQPPALTKATREHEPGRAAQRMLAQALGLRNPSMTSENRVRNFDGGTVA